MKVQILDEAEQDLVQAYRFYENRSPGLGNYFLDSLTADIDSLQWFAGIHSHFGNYYRLLSRRFPFAVYYKIENEMARIYAILDCRRDPIRVQNRLKI